MKILVTGNMGYVGSVVTNHLRHTCPHSTLIGLDTGFFATCLLDGEPLPERLLDRQVFADVREIPEKALQSFDVVVHLAGISNDPVGNAYAQVTFDLNWKATLRLGQLAKRVGVSRFIFASSCSAYGFAEQGERTETSEVSPLTAYAKSKVRAEKSLQALADDTFLVTCLRFATACGPSPRIRLDLVLNDFVATAIRTRVVKVLSDGTPWRPLIDVRDMALAIEWALQRDLSCGGPCVIVNVGTDDRNYQVKELAAAVAAEIPGASVEINPAARSDNRSYRVSFAKYRELAPFHQPHYALRDSIVAIRSQIEQAGFGKCTETTRFIRLSMLADLVGRSLLTPDLRWVREARQVMSVS